MGSKILFALLGVAGASLVACGGGKGLGANADGAAGSTAGASGAAGDGTAGGGGAVGGADAGAPAGAGGAAGSPGVAGSGVDAASDGAADVTGAAGLGVVDSGDFNRIVPTPGCGHDPGQVLGALVRNEILTKGTKPADCADRQCGDWSFTREYFVRLPTGYVATDAHPIVFEGQSCGAKGNELRTVTGWDSSVIRVGLSPSADAQAFHPVTPNQGCFDDREGDDSVDWPFYEALYDRLAATLCFDRNRVFVAGSFNGARMANQLACKYAGDPVRPVRAVMSFGSGLQDLQPPLTCSSKPLAGIWVQDTNDAANPFTDAVFAIDRAMALDGCPPGIGFATAMVEPFQLTTSDFSSCRRVTGCSNSIPLVVCPIVAHSRSTPTIVGPAWARFVGLFGVQ